MKTRPQRQAGVAWFGTLFALVLVGIAVAVYLRPVFGKVERQYSTPAPQASVRIVEVDVPGAGSISGRRQATLAPLPDDQLRLIKQVFAPELLD
jgi:hypothetical protein